MVNGENPLPEQLISTQKKMMPVWSFTHYTRQKRKNVLICFNLSVLENQTQKVKKPLHKTFFSNSPNSILKNLWNSLTSEFLLQ